MSDRDYGFRLLIVLVLLICTAQLYAADAGYKISQNLNYADDTGPLLEEQTLDVYWIDNAEKRPVIIYVHGGAWAFGDKVEVHRKPDFFIAHNIAFISMNYRLRWDYTVYDEAADVVNVIRWVKAHTDQYGLDPDRVILMGNASGAHLVSLVGTDERYLRAGELSFSNIRAVVSIDSTTFDIPRHIAETASFTEKQKLSLIFGDEAAVLRAVSPAIYVKPNKNIPAFALLYMENEEAPKVQARAFAKLLTAANVDTILLPEHSATAESIDESLGSPGNETTLALITFIRAKI